MFSSFQTQSSNPSTGFQTQQPSAGAFQTQPTNATGGGFQVQPSPGAGFQTQPLTTGFGTPSSTAKPQTASAFGSSQSLNFGQTQFTGATSSQTPASTGQPVIPPLLSKTMEKIQLSYAPYRDISGKLVSTGVGNINEDCHFKTVKYERTCESYNPDPYLTGTLLEQADRNNPDPTRYYPVSLTGIEALKKWFDSQNQEALKCQDHITKVREIISAIETSYTQVSLRFSALKLKKLQIDQKVLKILRKIEVLRCHGASLQKRELIFRENILRLLSALKGPYQELQEISFSMVQQQESEVYSEIKNEKDLEVLYEALQKQREGLEHIAELLLKDVRDISIIQNKLSESKHAAS